MDYHWRAQAVRLGLEGSERSILDVGVGTAKSLAAFMKRQRFDTAAGCDFSQGMLAVARERVKTAKLTCADLYHLPYQARCFDIVTASFVLRSVGRLKDFFSEIRRVLTERGKVIFLELTRPDNPLLWHGLYRPYVRFYLPVVGRVVSRSQAAYRFLSDSIQTFVEPKVIAGELEQEGFEMRLVKPLGFGAVTIFVARKRMP
jgi:demethylmenaquinone methyltransferase/2-methoxy-6-polyprenyl-1,4-benzoquinol methylase